MFIRKNQSYLYETRSIVIGNLRCGRVIIMQSANWPMLMITVGYFWKHKRYSRVDLCITCRFIKYSKEN